MRSEITKKLFTVDEYYRMAQAGILDPDARLELIEGEILEMSPVGTRHVSCVNRLNRLFNRRLGDEALVSVQNPVRLSNYTETQPDIVLLRPRDDCYKEKRISWEDACLVIEVSDTTIRRDRDLKLPLYSTAGISELWIIDLQQETLFAYREPGPKSYGKTLTLNRGGSLSMLAFPVVVFQVEELIG
jgi:Uma2 family endonuclease